MEAARVQQVAAVALLRLGPLVPGWHRGDMPGVVSAWGAATAALPEQLAVAVRRPVPRAGRPETLRLTWAG